MLRGFKRNFRPLEILTPEQVESIYSGALDVLEKAGVVFEHDRALGIFESAGCKIDREKKLVKIFPGLAEDCIRKCPTSFRIRARDPEKDIIIGGNMTYFGPFPGMHTVDLETWEPRTPTREEYYDCVRVMDALPTVARIGGYTPWFGFQGVPPVMQILEGLACQIRMFSKAITNSGSTRGCDRWAVEMAKVIEVDIGVALQTAPPLKFYHDSIDATFRFVEKGLPIGIGSTPISGGTAPATIAGSSVSGLAELIAGLTLIQLIKPGCRTWVANFTFPQNMKSGVPLFGDIAVSLSNATFCQIWRKLGVPTVLWSTGPSCAKEIGYQIGYERGILGLVAALSGANVISFHGGIHSELTFHPVLAILDDDVAGMIGRFVEGVEVSHESLALDLINQVGPIPGFFLDKEHTRQWWRREQFDAKCADRLTIQEWDETGRKNALDLGKERMEEILGSHRSKPLTSSQEERIEEILNDARQYYKKNGMITSEEWSEYEKVWGEKHYPYL